MALKTGDASRIVRALAIHGLHAAVPGPKGHKTSRGLLKQARDLAEQSSDPYPNAIVQLAMGMAEFLEGRFRQAVGSLHAAEQILSNSCKGVTWELDTARIWQLLSQVFLGDWGELAHRWSEVFRDAQDRGDLYAEVYLATLIMATTRLAADEPERAREELQVVMSRWSRQGFHVQHHNELMATILIHLYCGDAKAAWETIRDKESSYRKAMLWGVQQVRIDVLQLRARSALAAMGQTGDPEKLLRAAERDVRTLERESAAWGQALGALLRACLSTFRSATSEPNQFAAAAEVLECVDLGVFAAAARYRQGERTPGHEGEGLRTAAVKCLKDRGVKNPMRTIASHSPVR